MSEPEHPLNHKWVLWEHKTGGSNYQENLGQISEFDTVEGFWKLIPHIPLPSAFFQDKKNKRLSVGNRNVVGYSLFQDGIRPCWEDPKNIEGGEWRIRKFRNLDDVDKVWQDVVFSMIGERHNLKLRGARVVDSSNEQKRRIMYNVEVWFEDLSEKDDVELELMNTTGLEGGKFFFRVHQDAKEKSNLGYDSSLEKQQK